MRRIGLFTGLALAAVLPLNALADDQMIAVSAQAIEWKPAPTMPKGAQMAVLSGDPSKEGLFVVRVKVPAGYKFSAHLHPAAHNVTILSGSAYVGMGDKLDEKSAQQLKPGDYVYVPKGMNHYAWFTEETIFQDNSIGPTGVTYANPADDPRKTN
jgi:quercetin dioxygenase-like cupin family protein